MEPMTSTTITISERTRRELLKVAGELQQKRGKRVDYEDVIEYLLQRGGKSEILLRAASVPTGRTSDEIREALDRAGERTGGKRKSLSAATPKGHFAFDTGVLVEILEATPRAKDLLDAIAVGTLIPHVSLINIAEAEYIVCRKVGHKEARRRVESMVASGYYAIVDDPSLHGAAAEIKCERSISFVDCYTFAVAELTASVPLFASEEAEIVREMKRAPFKTSPSFLPRMSSRAKIRPR